MRNKWLWLIIVLAIVIAAFLFPRVMLWIEQSNAQDYVLSHGMGTLLNLNELKLSEKQNLLAHGTATFVQEDADADEYLEKFYLELEALYQCGALSEAQYSAFAWEMVEANVQRALDATGASFRLCMFSGRETSAYYDIETGKILCLAFYNGMRSDMAFEDHKDISAVNSLQAQLRSWAEYYGMRADAFVVTDMQGNSFSLTTQCTMTDSTGESFSFAAGVTETDGIFFFEAMPNETDSIQEGE